MPYEIPSFNWDRQNADLARRKQMIEALMQRSSAMPQGRQIGGQYFAPSFAESLMPALMMFAGGKNLDQLSEDQKALDSQASAQVTKALTVGPTGAIVPVQAPPVPATGSSAQPPSGPQGSQMQTDVPNAPPVISSVGPQMNGSQPPLQMSQVGSDREPVPPIAAQSNGSAMASILAGKPPSPTQTPVSGPIQPVAPASIDPGSGPGMPAQQDEPSKVQRMQMLMNAGPTGRAFAQMLLSQENKGLELRAVKNPDGSESLIGVNPITGASQMIYGGNQQPVNEVAKKARQIIEAGKQAGIAISPELAYKQAAGFIKSGLDGSTVDLLARYNTPSGSGGQPGGLPVEQGYQANPQPSIPAGSIPDVPPYKTPVSAPASNPYMPKAQPGVTIGADSEVKATQMAAQDQRDLQKRVSDAGIGRMITSMNQIDTLMDKFDAKGKGVPGIGPVENSLPNWMVSKEGQALRQSVANISNQLLKAQSGAAVSNQEYRRFLEAAGRGTLMSEDSFRQGLDQMRQDIASQTNEIFGGFDPYIQERFEKQAKIPYRKWAANPRSYARSSDIKADQASATKRSKENFDWGWDGNH